MPSLPDFFAPFVISTTSRVQKALKRIFEGWQILSASKKTLIHLVITSVLNALVTLLMIHFSFSAFGIQLPLSQSLILSNLFMVSSMIPATPSGLGIAEVIIVTASQSFVNDKVLSGLSAGLNRTVMIVNSTFWGILLSYVLRQRNLDNARSKSLARDT
jgi:uncharacterized protein (TIRG00374 family)